ncbi:MAG TPA: hypothetical protein VKX25_09490 [Bryobacteraceae bacterium]|jgi:hypothetical protein|nr:hypothetical protein [Bryobacteraceae bacterium]
MNLISLERQSSGRNRWTISLCAVALAWFLLLLLTRPVSYVDTFDYARHVIDQSHHLFKPHQSPFWDFGHVLWRPLGFAVWTPLAGSLRAFLPDDILAAGSVLMGLSIVTGLAGAIFLYLLLARTTGKAELAAAVTVAYLATHALLFYTPTGMAYIAGISCQIAALYFFDRFTSRGHLDALHGALAGLLLGLSVVIWFPYVLSVPGIICYALLIPEKSSTGVVSPDVRHRIPATLGFAAGTAGLLLAVYVPVMIWCGFTHPSAIAEWIARSRYDKAPINGLVRMVVAIPRALFVLDRGTNEWKRMLFQHHSVSPVLLIKTGIWKLALVYAMFALLAVRLWGSLRGRRLLVCLLVLALPVAVFAAFLFEAGPPERYLALFPLLFIGFAWMLAERRSGRIERGIVLAFFGCMLVTNVAALARFRSDSVLDSGRNRLQALQPVLSTKDCILVLSLQDETIEFVYAHPYSQLSRDRYLLTPAVPWGTIHVRQWREQLAGHIQNVWKHDGRIWISRRLFAPRPNPAWNWVEGDDPRVSWAEVRTFFCSLDLGTSVGGADGFSELARTPKNEAMMAELTGPITSARIQTP